MAKMSDITIKLDRKLSSTRLFTCRNIDCKHNHVTGALEEFCNLQWIDIDQHGACSNYEAENKNE